MPSVKQLLIDPAYFTVLDLVAERDRVKIEKIDEITGLKRERAVKLIANLEKEEILSTERSDKSKIVVYSSENREKIRKILENISQELEAKQKKIEEQLKDINRSIIKERSNRSSDKNKEFEKAQKIVSNALESLEEGRYAETAEYVEKLDETELEQELPPMEELREIRQGRKLISKWGEP